MTGRAYNPDEIRVVAGKVSGMNSGLTSAGEGITGMQGGGAFGKLPSSAAIAGSLKTFGSSLQKEFTAGAKLATSTGESLTSAADGMDGDEEATASTFSGEQPA